MAHKTDDLCSTDSISLPDKWIGAIGSWFQARRKKQVRNRDILQILSYDERLLRDMGFSRAQLIEELGYDPRESLELFGTENYRIPRQ